MHLLEINPMTHHCVIKFKVMASLYQPLKAPVKERKGSDILDEGINIISYCFRDCIL